MFYALHIATFSGSSKNRSSAAYSLNSWLWYFMVFLSIPHSSCFSEREHLRIIEWRRAFSTNTFALKNAFDLENGVPLLGHGCCNRFKQTPQMPQLAKSTSFSPQTSLNKNRINWNISSLSLFSLGFFPKNVSHFWTALVMSWFRNASTLLNCPLAMWPAPFNPHPVTWREQLQEFGWIQN